VSALRALQALSVDQKNKEAMWADAEGTRAALAESAMLCGDAEQKIRSSALTTLKNLTTEGANLEGMWNDTAARGALLLAATPCSDFENEDPVVTKARCIAMGGLRNIAGADFIKEAMWADEQTQAAVIAAASTPDLPSLSADAREAREHGMAALRHFAAPPGPEGERPPPLWKESEVATAAIAACTKLAGSETSDKKAREHAVAALRFTVC